MKFTNNDTRLELNISEELIERIAIYGKGKYPNEFGGLLLGRYTNNNTIVLIEDILLPMRYKSSRYYFERGSEGLKEALELKYYANPSLIYVGEWHTHPDCSPKPSRTDKKAMKELANDNKVLISNPVLMILEIGKQYYNIEFYFFYDNGLLRYDPNEEKYKRIFTQQTSEKNDTNYVN